MLHTFFVLKEFEIKKKNKIQLKNFKKRMEEAKKSTYEYIPTKVIKSTVADTDTTDPNNMFVIRTGFPFSNTVDFQELLARRLKLNKIETSFIKHSI